MLVIQHIGVLEKQNKTKQQNNTKQIILELNKLAHERWIQNHWYGEKAHRIKIGKRPN